MGKKSSTPIKDALDKLGTSGDGLTFEAALTEEKQTIGVEASKTAGTWTFSGAWQYAKDLGHMALGKVTWRPKAKE